MTELRAKAKRAAIRLYCGDLGVNQSAEVAGLVGVATAVTAGVITVAPKIGEAIGTFWTGKFA